jgi:hypothetical protein
VLILISKYTNQDSISSADVKIVNLIETLADFCPNKCSTHGWKNYPHGRPKLMKNKKKEVTAILSEKFAMVSPSSSSSFSAAIGSAASTPPVTQSVLNGPWRLRWSMEWDEQRRGESRTKPPC